VEELFYELRGHWRCDSHDLLYSLVKKSGSQKAMDKLILFRKKVLSNRKLKEVYEKSIYMQSPLPDGYSEMRAVVEKDIEEITIEECEHIVSVLTSYLGEQPLPAPDYEDYHSIKITWYISTEAVGRVLKRAYQAKEIFPLLSISFFEVGGIIVWNVKWPHSLKVCVH